MTNILALSGSLRAGSTNTKLLREAERLAGQPFTFGDLRLPLYDGDLEAQGTPAEVETLARQMAEADGWVIATPEYNGMLPGVLKNALDWVSRTDHMPFENKPVAILSAAAGRAGGARAQYSLRLALVAHRVAIVPGPEVMLAASHAAFDDDGRLRDQGSVDMVQGLMDRLKAAL